MRINALPFLLPLLLGSLSAPLPALAGWAIEAEQRAETKPLPGYLADELRALETYVAPEMDLARGENASDPIRLRQIE